MSDGPSSFPYSEFSVPVSRKKRRNKNENPKVPLIKLIQNSRDDLQQDEWSTRCQRLFYSRIVTPNRPIKPRFIGIILDTLDKTAWKTTSRVICLGLGSPSNSSISRAQLGFLLDVCNVLKIVCTHLPVGKYILLILRWKRRHIPK